MTMKAFRLGPLSSNQASACKKNGKRVDSLPNTYLFKKLTNA